MYNFAPADYLCPICPAIAGLENDQTLIRQSDIVYRDTTVMVFIATFFFGNNAGHLIVVPAKHYENIFDLPDEVGSNITVTARKMATVMIEAYGCTGVTLQQNNGPDGGQHAFHYHLHIFPRYANDDLMQYLNNKRLASVDERQAFANKITAQLKLAGRNTVGT